MATRADWAERIGRWKSSGLGATEFASREGVDRQQLSWWKWHLRTTTAERGAGRRAGSGKRRTAVPARAQFVPVRVAASRAESKSAEAESMRIEVAMREGHRLVIHGRVDPAWLTEVVRALGQEAAAC